MRQENRVRTGSTRRRRLRGKMKETPSCRRAYRAEPSRAKEEAAPHKESHVSFWLKKISFSVSFSLSFFLSSFLPSYLLLLLYFSRSYNPVSFRGTMGSNGRRLYRRLLLLLLLVETKSSITPARAAAVGLRRAAKRPQSLKVIARRIVSLYSLL